MGEVQGYILKGNQERIRRRYLEVRERATGHMGRINVEVLKKGLSINLTLGMVYNAPLASAMGR